MFVYGLLVNVAIIGETTTSAVVLVLGSLLRRLSEAEAGGRGAV